MVQRIAALLVAWLFLLSFDVSKAEPAVTLTGRHIVGYQGWFGCPSDGRLDGDWAHWFQRGREGQLQPTVDLLPDDTDFELGEGCPTDWKNVEGRVVRLYTAQDSRTVERHLAWMARYGLDGLALQRFLMQITTPTGRAARDRVLQNVRRAAEAHGRSFFIMYDLSGGSDADLQTVVRDWQNLLATDLVDSPAYQRHRGRMVLGVWGIGFRNRPLTPSGVAAFLTELRRVSPGGLTILGGIPVGWRTLNEDAAGDPAWHEVYDAIEVLSPWTVGRFVDLAGADDYRIRRLERDLQRTTSTGQDYMPVIFPGFSWSNLMRSRGRETILNQIPRRCGVFYWHQAHNAIGAGARMLYTAMFDEVDEGTAIFKLAPSASVMPDGSSFVPLNADGCDLEADWYLRLAGEVTRSLATRRN